MIAKEDVVKVLKDCYDPEIPVNVWDLGLVYDIQIEAEKINVKMTLTAPGCPMHTMISEDVRSKLLSLDGIKEATVQMVWDPPWSPDKMSEEAKAQLGVA